VRRAWTRLRAPLAWQVSDSYLGLDQHFDVDLGALPRSEASRGQAGGGPGAAAARGAAPEATLPAAPGVAPHVARAREASVAALRGPAAGPA